MALWIIAVVCFVLAVLAFGISIRSFQEKGFLFNNVYLYASKQEREELDKKPYYRQSAVTFLMMGIIMLLLGAGILLSWVWMNLLAMAGAVGLLVYVIASDIAITKAAKN